MCTWRRGRRSEKVPRASGDCARCDPSTGLFMEQNHVDGAFLERKCWWPGWSIYSEWKSQRLISEHAVFPERALVDQGLQAWSHVPEECLKYSAFRYSGSGTLINFLWFFLDFLSKNLLEILFFFLVLIEIPESCETREAILIIPQCATWPSLYSPNVPAMRRFIRRLQIFSSVLCFGNYEGNHNITKRLTFLRVQVCCQVCSIFRFFFSGLVFI